jgi:acetyl-CoA acetyltransferase
LSFVLKALIERTRADATEIEDLIAAVSTRAANRRLCVLRFAWLDAGLPESTPAMTVDR